MKILVLGAGAVGSVIIKFLNKDKAVKEIICGDYNLQRAKQFVNIKSKKISFKKIDANDESQIVKSSGNVDLIINASLPSFNTNIMKAALKVKSNYQDMCSHLDNSKKPEQLKYHDKFKKENLVGLINTGMSPGITNILAKNNSERLDEVYSIKIRSLIDQYAIEPIFAMSPEISLEESTSPSLTYRNGKFQYIPPFEEVEHYPFPEPIGDRFVFSVYGDEVATLSRHIKTKNVDFKSGGVDIESSKMLYGLGLLSDQPIKIGKASIVPLEFISQTLPTVPSPKEMISLMKKGIVHDGFVALVVELNGKKFRRNISIKSSIKFPTLKEITKISPGATYISYPTGLSAFSFSKIIPLIEEKGVLLPELLNPVLRNNVLTELISNGIQISETISQ